MDTDGRDDHVRALVGRLGLLDAKFSYRSLAYTKPGDEQAEFKDAAEFAYLLWRHVEGFLAGLPFSDYNHVDDILLLDAMATRYWVGQRWTRLGQTGRTPLYAKYKFEPRSENGNLVTLPYDFSIVCDE